MKSYAMPPKEFARTARLTEQYGTDLLCIVDSAGGMLTHELEDYFAATRDATELSLGFHGHDNLGLANANSLRAVELGAEIIDTSLQGLGRSADRGHRVLELVGKIRNKGLVGALSLV